MLLNPLGLILTAGFLFACSEAGKRAALPNVYVWAHDDALLDAARKAAARIEKASGIVIRVNAPGMIWKSVPIFWSDDLHELRQCGFWHANNEGGWVAISRSCADRLDEVMTHELIHTLWVPEHLGEDERGILATQSSGNHVNAITDDDLNHLCAVRDCTVYQPEA